jgi:hypothetical protein
VEAHDVRRSTTTSSTAFAYHPAQDTARIVAMRTVERSLDALEPLVARLTSDASISAEHAMHIVVMDPALDARTASFDDAILVERSFGDPARWDADYAWYARAKTRVSWRERRTLRTLLAQCPDRLQPDDIRVEGAVREGRWIVGASGAQPWYDHAIASIAIRLFEAAVEHERLTAPTSEEQP